MKYVCPRCNKPCKQLNLDRTERKWYCYECFYANRSGETFTRVDNGSIINIYEKNKS